MAIHAVCSRIIFIFSSCPAQHTIIEHRLDSTTTTTTGLSEIADEITNMTHRRLAVERCRSVIRRARRWGIFALRSHRCFSCLVCHRSASLGWVEGGFMVAADAFHGLWLVGSMITEMNRFRFVPSER
uniref:Putative secreted protein n=1 Tax=Anopheles marajoara TaxID=58244 RepID=A0A2M4C7H8_9DIPT